MLPVLAAALLACRGGTGPPTFETTFPARPGGTQVNALPVSLVDQTGLVTGIVWATGGGGEGTVSGLPGTPNAMRVKWTSGACDDRATLVFIPVGGGYSIAVHNRQSMAVITCEAAAVPRALDISLTNGIDLGSVTVTVEYP